ncbi:12688_t:CDS:1, partial [Ambispora gerdemannii]
MNECRLYVIKFETIVFNNNSSAQTKLVYWKRDPGVGTKSRIERVIVIIPQSSDPNIESQGKPYE